MVDIQTVSIAIASAGVFAAAIYYMLQIRHQAKTRTIDLAIRLDATWESKEFLDSWITVRERDPKEYDTWTIDNTRKWMAEIHISGFLNTLGFLVHKNLVDLELACNLFPIITAWEKMRPLMEISRKGRNIPEISQWFEYLYNEAKERRKKLQQSKV